MASESKEAASKHRILAVDDERANLNLLRRTFHRDYEILLAESGQEGLSILRGGQVDLIISDQRMPGMTGVQMLAESRRIHPNAVRIILTAYADVKDIIDSINEGNIYRYILKPWSPDELKVTVAKALDHFRLEEENRELVKQLQKSLYELKAAQQELLLRERLSTLGRMASSIIHDLKLPMSNIRTSAALLADENLASPLRKEFSDIIQKEVDRLIEMTREILEFSRGELKLQVGVFQAADLLDEIARMLDRDFTTAGIKLQKDWKNLGAIEGDYEKLRRVLLNLAINARDAMSKGGVLTIRARHHNGRITIEVADTGAGIPNELISRIFEPFVTHGKHNGTGLGLTIAKKIIEAHSGTIVAGNRPGGGAIVTIEMPVGKRDPN